MAQTFLKYFVDKIGTIRKIIVEMQESLSCASYVRDNVTTQVPEMQSFIPVSIDEMRKIIGKCNSKYCAQDPIQTLLLKACLGPLLPIICKIVNLPFSTSNMLKLNSRKTEYMVICSNQYNYDKADSTMSEFYQHLNKHH